MRAQSEALGVFARLFASGFTPTIHGLLGTTARAASDDEAADHYDLFGYRIPPHAGVFLNADGHLGGDVAGYAARTRTAAGLPLPVLEPDHISAELLLLAALLDRQDHEAAARFLDEHLLGWVPALVFGIRQQPYPAYRDAADLLLELLIAIRGDLPVKPFEPLLMAEAADPLMDETAGVQQIAEWLTTPVRAGIFVGRGEIALLGRTAETPRGFGGRRLMMGNLLRGAAHYDGLDAVVSELDRLAEAGADAWRVAGASGVGSVATWSERWVARIESTQSSLRELARQVKAAN